MITLQFTFLKATRLAWIFIAVWTVQAQSTVFNIPSTDVVPRGEVYLEADFMAHLAAYEAGGYQLYGGRSVYGLGKRAEIGMNAMFIRSSDPEPIEIQPNIKFRFYENEGKGLAAAVGVVVFIPISERSSSSTRSMIYGVANKSIAGKHGPRFTLGGYRLHGELESGASKQGVMIGYEQPLTRKITFVTDWSSGKNDWGYVVAGAGVALSPKSFLYLGYNIGNQGRGNNSVGVYYGRSF